MASDIEVTADLTSDADVSVGDVYDRMRLGADEISEQSPITPGLREVVALIGEDEILLRSQGHDGEWSKTSQDALIEALGEIDGVDGSTVEVVEGGYEQDGDEEDPEVDVEAMADAIVPEEEEDDVSEIDGVGAARAEQLREAGIETVKDVLAAGTDGLVEAGISEGVAENIVERAG